VTNWKAGDALRRIELPLTLRRAVQAVAGTRDYYPVHHDEEAASASGARTIFFNTMFLQAFAGRAANEWFGNDAFLRRLDVAMRAPNYIGQTLAAEGTVVEVRESDGVKLVDVDCTMSTKDGPTTGVKFTVELAPDNRGQVST